MSIVVATEIVALAVSITVLAIALKLRREIHASTTTSENFTMPQMKMAKAKKAIFATLLTILLAATAYAFIVWTWQTRITVMEPFKITTNLPESVELYPGNYSYWINVTNYGGETLNATLYYSVVVKQNCDITIEPTNGTSYTVEANETVSIPVTITVSVDGYPKNGTAIIYWWIDRQPP